MIYENVEEFVKRLTFITKLVCFDYGTKRIGFAVSDLSQTISFPSGTIVYEKNVQAIEKIIAILRDHNTNNVVFGLPLQMDGTEGAICNKVRKFVSNLTEKANIYVLMYDERLSSSAAFAMLSDTGLKRKQKDQLADQVAASFILQGVLDNIANIRRNIMEDIV